MLGTDLAGVLDAEKEAEEALEEVVGIHSELGSKVDNMNKRISDSIPKSCSIVMLYQCLGDEEGFCPVQ